MLQLIGIGLGYNYLVLVCHEETKNAYLRGVSLGTRWPVAALLETCAAFSRADLDKGQTEAWSASCKIRHLGGQWRI